MGRIFKKTEFKKLNIPANPPQIYKKEWKNWGDFLGTNYIATQKREYLSYDDAKRIVHKFSLKSISEWQKFCKSGKKPNNIPADFFHYYENKGLISAGDFLGTNTISNAKKKYLSYEEAKTYVQKLKFKRLKDLNEYFRKGKRPETIPFEYREYYKKEWVSYKDFLGPQAIGNKKDYMNYNDAIKIVHKLNLKSRLDYKDFCHSEKKPKNLPNSPEKVYKKNGWESWGQWLGTRRLASNKKIYRGFSDAKEFVYHLNLKNRAEWRRYCKSLKLPTDIPARPDLIIEYRSEWISWSDWLGNNK